VFVGDLEGEIARMIRQHGCGIAVAVCEGRRLATALQELQADPVRLAAMGANARRLALASYNSERAANDWVTLLAQVTHSPWVESHT
jgi:colanic acid biosynthesis glycosyl transferase WcaI